MPSLQWTGKGAVVNHHCNDMMLVVYVAPVVQFAPKHLGIGLRRAMEPSFVYKDDADHVRVWLINASCTRAHVRQTLRRIA